jgi:hypothetical protein
MEEARVQEQAEDFNRQEKILKLISTELTRNTTRVVEMAVKAEVQNSVLPALEHITRTEVRAALNAHVGRGLTEFIQNVRLLVFRWSSSDFDFCWVCTEPSERDREAAFAP